PRLYWFVGVALAWALVAVLVFNFFSGRRTGADDGPPQLNPAEPPGPAPEGMVWVPGGEFYMGDEDYPDAVPVHKVYVDGFWMDRTEVTNEQFAAFVKATGYVTVAERRPDAKDFPNVRPHVLGFEKLPPRQMLSGYPRAFPLAVVAPSSG